MSLIKIVDTTADNILDYGVCGYKDIIRAGYPEKVDWLKKRFKEGLKIKTLYSEKDGSQGMLEYIPGEYCWRPVAAKGYLFIHCIFVGFKSAYKRKGYASLLLDECENDAKKADMSGVAVVTRKGSFMVGKEFFLKKGYQVVDKAPIPKFKDGWEERRKKYRNGLSIIRADQCPYTVKNVNEICEAAEKIFKIKTRIIDLKNYKEAQESPCAFGTFCIVYNGEVIAEHPICKTRFTNIMNNLVN
jgi:hypothetical protein